MSLNFHFSKVLELEIMTAIHPIVYLENAWTSNQMITEGEAAILLETTRRAFRNQSQSKQRSTLANLNIFTNASKYSSRIGPWLIYFSNIKDIKMFCIPFCFERYMIQVRQKDLRRRHDIHLDQ